MSREVVSIIGAGPCGMAIARAVTAEGFVANVFEASSSFGGVWNYTGKGPLYKHMNTNIYSSLMEYKDTPMTNELAEFVDRTVVLDYVLDYARKIPANVHFNTRIDSAVKVGSNWVVTDHNGKQWDSKYLAVASGHCSEPFYPDIPGRDTTAIPVTHSRHFDTPDQFAGKTVVIVGNASSAIDITIQILGVTQNVLVVRRKQGTMDDAFAPYVDFKPEIAAIHKTSVEFTDGTSVSPEYILFCTGYLYSFPFLEAFNSTLEHPVLHPQRFRLCNLYRHTFYLADPTLAFTAMDKNIVPMPYAELQGTAMARVWSGRLGLEPESRMLELEASKVASKGDGLQFHSLVDPYDDVEYMTEMHDWIDTATGTGGFTAERWNTAKVKARKAIKDAKKLEIERRLAATKLP